MIYAVKTLGIKNHTSDHEVEATSPDHAIDVVLNTVAYDIKEVWCEDLHEIL